MSLGQALRSLCLVCSAVVVLRAAEAQPELKAAAFRANSQLVLVPVTVTDRNGKTVEGLRAADFHVFDDQRPQQIVSFANEDAPASIAIVLDISGSMRELLGSAKDITHAFLKTANTEDEFLLLTVSDLPRSISAFTSDAAAIEESVEYQRSGGETALIDTVYLGLRQMRQARRARRALLIVSDGIENHSRYSKNELMRVALEADVQVYSIIMDNPGAASGNTLPFRPTLIRKPGDQALERQGPQLLEDLSAKTGGLYFHIRNSVEAQQAVAKAGQALRSEYVLGYQLPDSSTAGKWHRVQVKSNVPKVNVYARNGYYFP